MRKRALSAAVICALMAAIAPAANAATQFRPRVGNLLGLIPPVTDQQPDIQAGEALTPVTYHGGPVMTGTVTIHTIFWTGGTNQFNPSPRSGVLGYEALIQQFLTDVSAAHTDTSAGAATNCTNGTNTCNVFDVLPQFAQETNVDHATGSGPPGLTSGQNSISYAPTGSTAGSTTNLAVSGDNIDDSDPYPAKSAQCASPQDTSICITDQEVQNEVDNVINQINANGGTANRGLHDLWYVFLPGGVDECAFAPGVCATNAFGGYHSLSDVNHGSTVYAVSPDLSIESRNVFEPGKDPEGNPDAEITIDVVAHEVVEAMTDPEGIGYMDPNGFEVGDKCEFGPQIGTVLGNAGPDSAPYNQVINGDPYLLQEMWANQDVPGSNGSPNCVQDTQVSTPPGMPLPQVDLSQFGDTVTGNIGSATSGVSVTVALVRANHTVATSNTGTTDSNGNWSVTLPRPVGDDRDEIDVSYSGTGAPSPSNQTIFTGDGGNPFSESGWTGWFALDNGSALTSNDQQFGEFSGPSLMMGPCFQVGLLSATLDGNPLVGGGNGEASPTEWCGTDTDVADMPLTTLTSPVGPSGVVTSSSNDNRAFIDPNAAPFVTANGFGGLVKLTVPVAETDAVGPFPAPVGFGLFTPGGVPTCNADIEAKTVNCTGLVPGEQYSVSDGSAHQSATADNSGSITVPLAVNRNDSVTLSNGSRNLTTLHVANLRVDITGDGSTASGGSCSADQYYGSPLTSAPTSAAAGFPSFLVGGSADTGTICPSNGSALGLPTSFIGQTDELSGGTTQTEVPDIADTSPMNAETVYGAFTALAEATDGSSAIAVSIRPSAGGSAVFTSSNVDTANGVPVSALTPGTYTATWTLTDANGDTRTITSRFIEERAISGPPGPPGAQGQTGPRGPQGPAGPRPKISCRLTGKHHTKIKCKVTFPKKAKDVKGSLQVRIARGRTIAALGHSRLRNRKATVTMRELHRLTAGTWRMTFVIKLAHHRAQTVTMQLLVP